MVGKSKKTPITIYYDPRDEPKIEVYYIDPKLAEKDTSFMMANYRADKVYSMIYNILWNVGFDPSVCLFKRVIKEPGEPHFIPVVYVNHVLFSTVYTFRPDKFKKVMEEMRRIKEEYFAKLRKDMDKGYIIYPNEAFIHLRDPLLVNTLVSSKEILKAKKLGTASVSIDPQEEIPATEHLVRELEKMCVPITPIGFAEEKKYKVLVVPDKKGIEL